ncbi:hypothetical protein QTP88_022876 [Uroleucon formosanum]
MSRNQPTVSSITIVNNKIVNKNKTNNKIINNEGKRTLFASSTPPSSPSAIIAKKAKLFVKPNRYGVLIADDVNSNPDNDNIDIDSQHETLSQGQLNTTNNTPKSILPPPVFIKDVLDYIGLRNSIKDLIGPTNFSCKSSTAHLKIQTDNPDNYRKLIRLLKDINAQYHTYQLHSEKSLRIVVKNLHPTTPVNEIAAAIEKIGHSVKNVTNIKQNLHFRCSLLISTLMKAITTFSPSLPYYIQKSKLKNRIKNGKYHNFLTANLMATPEPTSSLQNVHYVPAHTQQTIRDVSSSNNSDRSVPSSQAKLPTSQVKPPTSQATILNRNSHPILLAI